MRRIAALLVLAAAGAALAASGPASASQLLTWTVPSRHVDPAKVQFNNPPPGVPPLPPALRANVLLPDGYDGSRRFPVLYLLHGHGDTYAHWAAPSRGNVAAIAGGLGAIVVMPEGARGWYTNWWNGGRRGDPGWERYHLDELIPLVERRLRIRPGRRWRAIAGLPMGGEGALFYARQRPGYFGSAGSFSGTISIERPEWPAAFETQGERYRDVFGDPQARRFYIRGHNPTGLTDNLRHTRLFVAAGNGEPGPGEAGNTGGIVAELVLARHAEDFAGAARRSGANVTFRPQQGIHDWPYWRRHLGQHVAWGPFAPVEESPSSWRLSTVQQSGDAWGLRFRFKEPPATLQTFVRSGSVLSATGSGTVTITMPGGCSFTVALPFRRVLTPDCRVAAARAAFAGLRIGGPRGMGRARRGRPFRIRVRALGSRLRGVRISVYGRRGRRVGGSRPFGMGTHRRYRPLVRVKGRLRGGGYRIVARARTPGGRRIRGATRTRLPAIGRRR